jgi:hypothetical protein
VSFNQISQTTNILSPTSIRKSNSSKVSNIPDPIHVPVTSVPIFRLGPLEHRKLVHFINIRELLMSTLETTITFQVNEPLSKEAEVERDEIVRQLPQTD